MLQGACEPAWLTKANKVAEEVSQPGEGRQGSKLRKANALEGETDERRKRKEEDERPHSEQGRHCCGYGHWIREETESDSERVSRTRRCGGKEREVSCRVKNMAESARALCSREW